MSLKRALHLMLLGLLVAGLLAACGDSTATPAPTPAPATAAATTAPATTVAATTAVATTAAATTAAPAATTVAATTVAATTVAATTAVATTAAATTAAGGGASALIEDVKFDGTGGKKGGQFVYAYSGQFPTGLNPYYISDNVAIEIANIVYGTLVGQDSNNKYYAYLLKEVPTLDNGDVKVTSDNKMDITLNLKPGIKWSDGSPITSQDLAFTIGWVNDPANGSLQVDTTAFALISSVDTPTDSTAVLHFKQVYGPYLNFLNGIYILPKATWGKIAVADAEKSPEADVPTLSSGPFKVDQFTTDDRVVLSRNDNFTPVWGFNAYLDKITFRNTPDANTALASVSTGELDAAENLDDNQGPAAGKIANATYNIAQQYSWEFLQLNLSNPLFQDLAVRQALDMALDKQALIKQFRTPKTTQLPVDAVPPFSPFFNSSLAISKYDPAAANALLDKAGWTKGSDGIRVKDGKKLAFQLSSTTAPVRVSTAAVMVTYWKAIGADVQFQSYPSSQFFGSWAEDGILAKGKYDVGMFAQVAGIDPDAGYNNYVSTAIPTDANKGNGSNYGRINDPIIDKAFTDERATVDQTKRIAAFNAFQLTLHDNLWELPLYSRVNNYIVNKRVNNYKANATTDGNLWNSVELWVTQ